MGTLFSTIKRYLNDLHSCLRMTDQDKILQFLRMNGPSLPSKIGKLLGTDLLLASAHLSDLISQGKVKVSSLKIGGSPLYYIPGQEQQLSSFAAGNMNPKDVAVLHSLQDKQLLREAQLPLLDKVALRSLKDFAIPLQVTVDGQKELFWKWHLCSAQEANDILSAYFAPAPPEMKPVAEILPPSPLEAPLSLQKTLAEPPILETEERKALKPRSKYKKQEEEFFPLVEEMCKKLKISIEQKETLRKNAELELVLKVPSAVGTMTYFCKAKNKAKCDEKDLSAAYMQAQIKKLPLLLLHTGELTKKAQEMLESGAFENVMVRKV